jgi:hypothetical protein
VGVPIQQQQQYPILPERGMGEVDFRQVIPLSLGNPRVRRLLPDRPPEKCMYECDSAQKICECMIMQGYMAEEDMKAYEAREAMRV